MINDEQCSWHRRVIKHIFWKLLKNMTLRFPPLPGPLMQCLLNNHATYGKSWIHNFFKWYKPYLNFFQNEKYYCWKTGMGPRCSRILFLNLKEEKWMLWTKMWIMSYLHLTWPSLKKLWNCELGRKAGTWKYLSSFLSYGPASVHKMDSTSSPHQLCVVLDICSTLLWIHGTSTLGYAKYRQR